MCELEKTDLEKLYHDKHNDTTSIIESLENEKVTHLEQIKNLNEKLTVSNNTIMQCQVDKQNCNNTLNECQKSKAKLSDDLHLTSLSLHFRCQHC